MVRGLSGESTAEERLRRDYPRVLWWSLVGAVALHAAVAVLLPEIRVEPYRLPREPVFQVVQLPDVRIPPPPEEQPRKEEARAFLAAQEGPADETISGTGIDLNEPVPPFPVGPTTGFTPIFDEEPVVVRMVRPAYPELAVQAELEGTVLVRIGVDTRGDVVEAAVIKSVPGLDEAAVDAVLRWKFRPATQGGTPVAVRIVVPVRFTLRG